MAIAAIATLVLGGASAAQAGTVAPLDAQTDLEFSLDGVTWTDAPDPVLGAWGCDGDDALTLTGGATVTAPTRSVSGVVDPCAMLPGESVDRTYHVRNSTDSGRTGRYEVGVGDFEVSDGAEFSVSSTITGDTTADSGSVMLYGEATGQADSSPARGDTVATLFLAPGQSARVVDEVSVPIAVPPSAQRQSVSPRMWVAFSDLAGADRDRDGLPDTTEELIGTDPGDPLNRLPSAGVGRPYGPEAFLPTPPDGATLDVDKATLPPGMSIVDGALAGTPTRDGTYDIAFTITLPGGEVYTSVRRVVVDPAAGGGSSDLPDYVWPVIVVGLIGVVAAIFGLGAGSAVGSLGGPWGGSLAPDEDGDRDQDPSAPAGAESTGSGPGSDPGSAHGAEPDSGPAEPDSGPADIDSPETGRVEKSSLTPREAAPSDEWVRANSEVRGSLATTGVGASQLVLWALTAAAAGITLVLFARRRHQDERPADPD